MRAWVVALACLATASCSAITSLDTHDLEVPATRDAGFVVRFDAGPISLPDSGQRDDARSEPLPDAGTAPRPDAGCRAEQCANGSDDDCDALVDAADPDCVPPRRGDTCADARTLVANGPSESGDTSPLRDDVTSECQAVPAESRPDAFYSFALDTDADLVVDTLGSGYDTIVSLRAACPTSATELACSNDSDSNLASRLVVLNAARGSYTVVVDGDTEPGAGPFVVRARTTAPVTPSCARPFDMSAGGAVFGTTSGTSAEQGSCGGSRSPEHVFVITLTERARLVAHTLDTSFDTVLYLRSGACPDNPRRSNEIACNLGNLDVTLDPGTYYLFMDGASLLRPVSGRYRLVAYFDRG